MAVYEEQTATEWPDARRLLVSEPHRSNPGGAALEDDRLAVYFLDDS